MDLSTQITTNSLSSFNKPNLLSVLHIALNTMWHNIYKFTIVTDQLYCKGGGGGAILCVVLTSATGEDPAPSTTPIHNNQILPNSMGEIANWLIFWSWFFLIVIFSCDTAQFIYRRP